MAAQNPSQGRRRFAPSLAGELLAHAATGAPLDVSCCAGGDARQFRWVLEGGFGPLLHRACGPGIEQLAPDRRDALRSADLTARLAHADRVETALEVLDACERHGVAPILLKGISIAAQLYPAEHLRPMGDIDVLIPPEAHAAIERTLVESGYLRLEGHDGPGHHHGAPLRHARLRTIVELHTALFPRGSLPAEGRVFDPARVAGQAVASSFHGRPVRRLAPELQLAYIASSWFNDLTHCRPHPSFLTSAFDAAYLMAAFGPTMDWHGMPHWLDNEWSRASLQLLLSYLPRYGVAPAPPDVLARIASGQRLAGPIQSRLIHRMLDRQQLGGEPWVAMLPPPMPGRYSPRHQLRKRILARLPRSRGAVTPG